MATILRNADFAPRLVARRLIPDFVPQNLLLAGGFVPPGNPVFPQDTSSPVRRSPWIPSQYEAAPDVPLPTFAPSPPTLTHPPIASWGPLLRVQGRMKCLFDPPNVALLGQSSARFSPFQPADLTPRLTARRPMDVQYPPNTTLTLLQSNPYVPVDLSARSPAPRRNSSLYFDYPNLAAKLLPTGARPIIPVDWNMRATVRRPISFDAPNIAVSLTTSNPYIPVDVSDPPKASPRVASLYEARNGLLPTLVSVPAVLPPGAGEVVIPATLSRYYARLLKADLTWVPGQTAALLSPPIKIASIPNLNYRVNSGVQIYEAGTAFTSAVSYSISPATDAGITFNTTTGRITTDTGVAAAGPHGPYTITATNGNGSVVSNAFTITLGAGDYCVDGPRLIESTTALGATYTVSGPKVTRDSPESKDLS